jgi:hypothetical protein
VVQDDSAARDVLATYHEVRHRKSKELDAYQAAVRVYKGHHPTVSDRAAREAVNKILAVAPRRRESGG